MEEESSWRFSKSVPISVVLFLIVQSVALIVWATRLDYRVAYLESTQPVQDSRISSLETLRDKIVLIEERQNNVISQLRSDANKLDEISNKLNAKQP